MRRSILLSALLPLAMAALPVHEYHPRGGPRGRGDDDLDPERKPTGPSQAELKSQTIAAEIRAERLRRKAEAFAKRQPKAKPT